MKKKGKLAACLILLIVLLAVLVVLTQKNSTADDSSTDTEADAEKIVDLDKDDVTAVSFLIDGTKVSFTKKDDTWSYDADSAFPLKDSSLTSAISSLCSMSAERTIEGEELSSLEDYGLAEPSNTITLTKDDQTTTIQVGDKNSSGNYYVSLNDETDKVYLVSTSFDTLFPTDLMEWAQSDSMPSVTADNITRIEVTGENGYTLEKTENTEDSSTGTSTWRVADTKGKTHDANADEVSTLTSAAASLSFGDLVDYHCEDLSKYGLSEPQASIKVHYTEEQTVEDETSSENTSSTSSSSDETADSTSSSSTETKTVTVEKDLVLHIGNTSEDGSYYVVLDGSKEVHLMTASNVETFTKKTASDYWNMYIGMENVSDLTSLTITYQGETKTFERHVEEKKDEDSDTTTQEVSYTCGDETIDKTTFTTFYSSLIGLQAQKKDESLTAPQDAEFTAVFHMNSGDVTYAYSVYDTSFYYTTDQDGVPSLVNKNNVKTMLENYAAVTAAKAADSEKTEE